MEEQEKQIGTLPPPKERTSDVPNKLPWYRLSNPSTADLNTLQQICLGAMAFPGFLALTRPSNVPAVHLFRASLSILGIGAWIAIHIIKKRRGAS
jgi:hypothetical protein